MECISDHSSYWSVLYFYICNSSNDYHSISLYFLFKGSNIDRSLLYRIILYTYYLWWWFASIIYLQFKKKMWDSLFFFFIYLFSVLFSLVRGGFVKCNAANLIPV